ncbi:P-loop containing nucleoside triphosphate hydrolase protein [Russula compacta]|nr:P-loop containing nucleoside triphosphate hydrolase protein [Russula compacta]
MLMSSRRGKWTGGSIYFIRFRNLGLPIRIRNHRSHDYNFTPSVLTLHGSLVHIYVAPAPPLSLPALPLHTHTKGTSLYPMLTHTLSPELHVKVLVIGNPSVGKSSLLMRWSENQWLPEDEASPTIGVEVMRRKLDVKGENVNLTVWDTAGEEQFRTMQSAHYRGAQGILLVYDATCRQSFEELTRWFAEIATYVSGPVVKVLVGNKVDKEFQRQVPTAEAAAFAKKMGCDFVETSAKTAVGVRKVFHDVVERITEEPELRVVFKHSPPQASFARPQRPRFLTYH